MQRAITDEFARAVRGEVRQPLDVHRGVHVQRLLSAVVDSIRTGNPALVSEPDRHGGGR